MTRPASPRMWTDEQLATAVEKSANWRAVAHELGLKSTSAGVIRTVRSHVEKLGLDTSHFRGGRSWTDKQLRSAISGSRTWDEAITKLSLSVNSGNIRAFLKSHAVRLGVDYSHLASSAPTKLTGTDGPVYGELTSGDHHLREAAASMAAAWFTMSGCAVSLPVEPAVYDLLAELPDGIKRIQVKTTTFKSKNGWAVNVGHKPHKNRRRRHAPYELGDIDLFFVIDGDSTMYLIPAVALAGSASILLRTYKPYIIGNAGGLGTTGQPSIAAA